MCSFVNFKIKTNLWSGIIMGAISAWLLLSTEKQVRIPAFDSGAPSPRIIPYIVLTIMAACSVILIFQSLVLKKEKIVEFNWSNENPILLLIAALCVYVVLIQAIGFVMASLIVFPAILFYCGERKPPIYIFTIAMTICIFVLFKFLFHISLPTCPFL